MGWPYWSCQTLSGSAILLGCLGMLTSFVDFVARWVFVGWWDLLQRKLIIF